MMRNQSDIVSERTPRREGWLLVALALGLLLAGMPAPVLEPADAAAVHASLAGKRVAAALETANPSLSPAEVERIRDAVVRYSRSYGLDPDLVTAVLLVESGARPWARSPKGARGLMQVMPYMMRPMGLAGNLSTIESNVEAGCVILAGNIRRLGEEDGISAYFWGSNIQGGGYLQRVQAAREKVRAARGA
jgi:soluble lytic murein transglycosylase-like protein